MQLDKLRVCRDKDDQLDNQSMRYEERLVELHSVIAELSRQLEQKARERVVEEEDSYGDRDGAETTTSCGDIDDGEDTTSEPCQHVQANAESACNIKHLRSSTYLNQASAKSDVLSRTSTDVIDAEAIEVNSILLGYMLGNYEVPYKIISR